jgi:hypothetical protein
MSYIKVLKEEIIEEKKPKKKIEKKIVLPEMTVEKIITKPQTYKYHSQQIIKDIKDCGNLSNGEIKILIEFLTIGKLKSILYRLCVNTKEVIEMTLLNPNYLPTEKEIINVLSSLFYGSPYLSHNNWLPQFLDSLKKNNILPEKILKILVKKKYHNLYKYINADIKTFNDLDIYLNEERFIHDMFTNIDQKFYVYGPNHRHYVKNNIYIDKKLKDIDEKRPYDFFLNILNKIDNLDCNLLFNKLNSNKFISEENDNIFNIILLMKDLKFDITEDYIFNFLNKDKNGLYIINLLFSIETIYNIKFSNKILEKILNFQIKLDMKLVDSIGLFNMKSLKITLDMLENSIQQFDIDTFTKLYVGEYNEDLIEQFILINYPPEFVKLALEKGANITEKIFRLAICNNRNNLLEIFIDNKYIPTKKDIIGIYNYIGSNIIIIKILSNNGLSIDLELYKYLEEEISKMYNHIIKKEGLTKKENIFNYIMLYFKYDEENIIKFKKEVIIDDKIIELNKYSIKKMYEKNDIIELDNLFKSENYKMIMYLLIKYNYVPTENQYKSIKDQNVIKYIINNYKIKLDR